MSTWDVKAGRVIHISCISHIVGRVQLADLNQWVVFNLSSCGLYLPLPATQPLSHRILTNKNRKRHIPCAYMNNTVTVERAVQDINRFIYISRLSISSKHSGSDGADVEGSCFTAKIVEKCTYYN